MPQFFTFVQPILERNDRFSFNDVACQVVAYIHHTLTVEEFPGVETTSRLIQLELVSTKIMVILAQHISVLLNRITFQNCCCDIFYRLGALPVNQPSV